MAQGLGGRSCNLFVLSQGEKGDHVLFEKRLGNEGDGASLSWQSSYSASFTAPPPGGPWENTHTAHSPFFLEKETDPEQLRDLRSHGCLTAQGFKTQASLLSIKCFWASMLRHRSL